MFVRALNSPLKFFLYRSLLETCDPKILRMDFDQCFVISGCSQKGVTKKYLVKKVFRTKLLLFQSYLGESNNGGTTAISSSPLKTGINMEYDCQGYLILS